MFRVQWSGSLLTRFQFPFVKIAVYLLYCLSCIDVQVSCIIMYYYVYELYTLLIYPSTKHSVLLNWIDKQCTRTALAGMRTPGYGTPHTFGH